MARLSKALGGTLPTMMGMSGLGDLVLTASCSQSKISVSDTKWVPTGRRKTAGTKHAYRRGIASAKAVVKTRPRSRGGNADLRNGK